MPVTGDGNQPHDFRVEWTVEDTVCCGVVYILHSIDCIQECKMDRRRRRKRRN